LRDKSDYFFLTLNDFEGIFFIEKINTRKDLYLFGIHHIKQGFNGIFIFIFYVS